MTNRPLPTREELDAAYADIARIHARHLAQHGVRMPSKDTYPWVWLATLYHYAGERVHKNEISEATRLVFPDAAPDQQVRHLVTYGWNIENKLGYHTLLDPTQPSPTYMTDRLRRQGSLSAESFDDLKRAYGYRCATCNTPEGEVNPRYGRAWFSFNRGIKIQAAGRTIWRTSCRNANSAIKPIAGISCSTTRAG